MALNSLHKLYVEQLQDLYSAETQLVKALPKMAKAAANAQLKQAFEKHLMQTETHVQRLEQIFDQLGKKPGGHTCKGMAGLITEGEEMLKMKGDEAAVDAGLIAAAQRVEHYEMAAYGTLVAWAQVMGHTEAVDLLQQTLDEEKATDEKLTEIAESGINQEAADAAHPQGDEDDEDDDGQEAPRQPARAAATSRASVAKKAAKRR